MARRNCVQLGVLLLFAVAPAIVPAQGQPASAATLDRLQQTAQSAVAHISALRIEKWKADSATKRGAQSDAESLQRNMASALPELIGNLRANPQNLNANFKLYRNIEVLYDVFSRFTETVGAFGPKDDYETLARDLEGLEAARHSLGDTLDAMTASSQTELDQLRAQARAAQQTAAPPKKIVVDDSQPAPHKKKPAAKSAASKPKAAPSPSPSATKTP